MTTEDFIEVFCTFLRERKVYDLFLRNFNIDNKNRFEPISFKDYLMTTPPDDFINAAFNWGTPPTWDVKNYKFWMELHLEWLEVIK